jgi:hypothetical protein
MALSPIRELPDAVRRWVVQAEGRWFDVTRNVRTAGIATLGELTLAGLPQDGFPYIPSRAGSARRALRDLPIRDYADFTFIDFGSGKGRVLFIAAEYPFRRIQGVEFAKELHFEATQNLLRYRHRKQRCRKIESLHMRAEDFSFPNENLVLYFFNPFPAPVLERVLGRLSASLEQHPRDVFLLLLFPEMAHIVDAMPRLRIYEKNRRYHIYRTIPGRSGLERCYRAAAFLASSHVVKIFREIREVTGIVPPARLNQFT